MPVLSIIFDLDGTLLDTLEGLAYCANTVLRQRGWKEHPVESYRRFVGGGLRQLIVRITPQGLSDRDISQCCEEFNAIYHKNWKHQCAPYPGVPEMLGEIVSKQIPIAILSNKPHEFTRIFVREFFPSVPFSLVWGQRPGVPEKPDPTAPLQIAKQLDCDPADMLFVGDSDVDILTGRNAGMISCGVLWGFRSEQELRDSGAHLITHNPAEISQYVCNTP